ncbi:unnamed protein product [Cochlearia groenlandica]
MEGRNENVVKVLGTVILSVKEKYMSKDPYDILGKQVKLRLISSDVADPDDDDDNGRKGSPSHLEWDHSNSVFKITFDYEKDFGYPGAFLIRNEATITKFFLISLTLEGVPGYEGKKIHYICDSWIYPSNRETPYRLFFSNKTYLRGETPKLLLNYREKELESLRGTGKGERKVSDRVYDYDYYNDLGNPTYEVLRRPVLGGTEEYPYPRRGRTGRKISDIDHETEEWVAKGQVIYVPRDERPGNSTMHDSRVHQIKGHVDIPEIQPSILVEIPEFDSFKEVLKLFHQGIELPNDSQIAQTLEQIPFVTKDIIEKNGQKFLMYPVPQVIKDKVEAWQTDDEFAREMLAGLNPLVIQLLEDFPPQSKLDEQLYGDQNSTITRNDIKGRLDGLTVNEALEMKRLFILDHHDTLMPYLGRINTTGTKTYATRTILFLKDDGTLTPLVIELSLPHPNGDKFGAVSEVYTPDEGTSRPSVNDSMWQLAKAYVAANDSSYHQLISHWLHTHAAIEPILIATNRQLSVVHPIHKLLKPHFRETMNINALARQSLINASGFFEVTFLPSMFSMEMSSFIYKNYWTFPGQALPADLKNRGMAVEDPEAPHGLRFRIKDYPFAVDGIEIWYAIEEWVRAYISLYYKTEDDVGNDTELQAWWKEVREVGHGDKKSESWWPDMQSREELIQSCTIIIWVASALHAAVNFGQYPIAGYFPNRPTLTRMFMPKEGTQDFEDLTDKDKREKVFLKTVTSHFQAFLGMSLIEFLSTHSGDEVYLGQRDSKYWTDEKEALDAFYSFGESVKGIDDNINKRNLDENLKNRNGLVKMPYTLLLPTAGKERMGRGIPNSVSI